MQPGRIVDLFAGAGGWDEGLRQLGHEAVGIEYDQLRLRNRAGRRSRADARRHGRAGPGGVRPGAGG